MLLLNDNDTTLSAMPINTITATSSISVKPDWRDARMGLLPVAVILVQAVATGLAVLAVEDDVEVAVIARRLVKIRMLERVLQIRFLRIRAVPVRGVAGARDQIVQALRRRTVIEHVGLHLH